MIVEICANNFQSALNAQEAGADRIELCSELAVGGITPNYGLLKKVSELKIPVHVLIRPRSGDFMYSDSEFEVMKQNIALCKQLNCSGVVSGVLKKDMSVDMVRTKALIDFASPMTFTFHRAFDWTPNPLATAKKLAEIGVVRILTSGQAVSAIEGLPMLIQLRKTFNGIILAAGGINLDNVSQFKAHGFEEIHLSVTVHKKTIDVPKISLNSAKHFDETMQSVSSLSIIKQLISQINA
ncbi:MAG: copper homeostasis protein CutC [Flavobacteriaceae bacterium]|nr:copper homeostasis protein CutC [Flavobacteriaceae bacterium]|tara:strand:- start:2500 stop:3216 length:717 start_codon:yes stop_codon:yes gene_type:complete